MLSFRLHQSGHHNIQQRCFISVHAAKRLLGLSPVGQFSFKDLRARYLDKAKKCHPDTKDENTEAKNAHSEFILLTEAYQVLQQQTSCGNVDKKAMNSHWKRHSNNNEKESQEDEQNYREACLWRLGVDAEIVEECKRSPMFLQWLEGRTDAAQTWRDFIVEFGGLGPKLGLYRSNRNALSTSVRSSGPLRRSRKW